MSGPPTPIGSTSLTTSSVSLRNKLNEALTSKSAIPVAMPPCSDVLVSLIKSSDTDEQPKKYFFEYFSYGAHQIFPPGRTSVLETSLEGCLGGADKWPPGHCLPPSCVTLKGNRRVSGVGGDEIKLQRLFIGDLLWLFYFEKMGIFKILGVILDDFSSQGKFPIPNDDVTAIVLESMVRQTKTGLSSTVRDRDSSYRRCLGWTSDVGRKLDSTSAVNAAFSDLFHKFIQSALEFYKDKNLAEAIRGRGQPPAPPSAATLTSIANTIEVLKQAFNSFNWGRNHSNALSGIVWVIAGMSLVRSLRSKLGIPDNLNTPQEYIPAAYDLLVEGKAATPSETNRYMTHRDCAVNGRDVLLDLEVLDSSSTTPGSTTPGGELDIWLDLISGKIEGYRAAYRTLTGVDLGAPGTPAIEQQAQ